MPKTRISCPNCRQPLIADVDQLFDAGRDPTAKAKLTSGAFNLVRCPHCGYQGSLATPIVYHDPQKELLLTFFPGELGLPRNEQERMLGALINQVVNSLPQEKRKAYLLRPQSFLTLQSLIERVLEADGITREMIQAQQQRLNLLQRLLAASPDGRDELIKSEAKLLDAEFFTLVARLGQAAAASGDQASANKIAELQQDLLAKTEFGKEIQDQTKEIEAAMASLRELGDEITREKLLDLLLDAPNDTRLSVLVSLLRPGLDYQFFQLLSERIDGARSDGRARLINLREKLLEMTREIDRHTEARAAQAQQLLNQLVQAENPEQALLQVLPNLDDLFMNVLATAIDAARKQGDLERLSRLQRIEELIRQATTPPEIEFIEQLLSAPDETARRRLLEENKELITQELLDTLTNIAAQINAGQDRELAEQINALHRTVLRYSMQIKLSQ